MTEKSPLSVGLRRQFIFKLGSESSGGAIDFIGEVKEPAIRMIKLYLAQAVMTATYIYSLSCVGKCFIRQ